MQQHQVTAPKSSSSKSSLEVSLLSDGLLLVMSFGAKVNFRWFEANKATPTMM